MSLPVFYLSPLSCPKWLFDGTRGQPDARQQRLQTGRDAHWARASGDLTNFGELMSARRYEAYMIARLQERGCSSLFVMSLGLALAAAFGCSSIECEEDPPLALSVRVRNGAYEALCAYEVRARRRMF